MPKTRATAMKTKRFAVCVGGMISRQKAVPAIRQTRALP
jgi:hypothetical protein